MFPVLKKADCMRVRKKRDIRASVRVNERKGEDASEVGIVAAAFNFVVLDNDSGIRATWMRCSTRTHVTNVTQNTK